MQETHSIYGETMYMATCNNVPLEYGIKMITEEEEETEEAQQHKKRCLCILWMCCNLIY